jgi:hypothetical protein
MLTQRKVERLTEAGRYRDNFVAGLYLSVAEGGAKSWLLRYELHGREHMMGLGSAATFSLKEARERARSARQLLADGIDPLPWPGNVPPRPPPRLKQQDISPSPRRRSDTAPSMR